MSHPRIEEVSDSDVSDPSEGDISDFEDTEILRRVSPAARQQPTTAAPPGATYADHQCLYPVYFDASRSRAEGRRVSAALAVASPLAAEIANACQRLGLATVLEATKLHPKDWANPGRVRVRLGGGGRGAAAPHVRNKHHLFVLVARHLREHPTSERSPALHVRLPGAPAPEPGKPYPRPAVPRGWKMGELLPYYSPAMTGGGVSENFFKDMMREMQQGGGGDMASLLGAGMQGAGGAGEGGRKKDRKGKGKG